jgi:proteasome lid subunit RPN8/RPN11
MPDKPPTEPDREPPNEPPNEADQAPQPDSEKLKGSLAWQQDNEPDIELTHQDGPETDLQTATPPVVYFAEEVVAEMKRHACADTSHEIAGIMAGYVDQQHNSVHVHACIAAQHTRASQGNVTFTHESWAEINAKMDAEYPDYVILGWYHSHPNFGVFLSSYDIFIHRNFFSAPWQIAYVIDPVRHDEGCFVWEAGELVRIPEIKLYVTTTTEGEPPAAAQTRQQEVVTAGANIPIPPMPPAPPSAGQAGQKTALFALSVLVAITIVLQVYVLTEIFRLQNQLDTMPPATELGAETQRLPEPVDIAPDIAAPPPATIPCDTYEVTEGDTLEAISERFYATPDHAPLIALLNGITGNEQLEEKHELLIPKLPETKGVPQ